MRADFLRLTCARLLVQADEHDGVVGKVLAYPRQIGTHLDAILLQMICWADALLHQKVRRVDTAQRTNHLAREKYLLLDADPRFHSGDTAAFEHKGSHRSPIDDGEVLARAHGRIEITDRR